VYFCTISIGSKLLQPGALGDLVLAFVHIVHQVAHVGDVAHVAHLVAHVREPAVEHIEGEEAAHVAQVHIAVHGRSAHVQSHMGRTQGNELLLLPRERVGEVERSFLQVGHGFGTPAKVAGTERRQLRARAGYCRSSSVITASPAIAAVLVDLDAV
jgi:hypothetical protein